MQVIGSHVLFYTQFHVLTGNLIYRIIVYASSMLPTTLCETKYCKDVYETLIGTSYMAVPCGSMNRLEKWPALEYRDDFPIVGQGNALVSSEIVLSSIGK